MCEVSEVGLNRSFAIMEKKLIVQKYDNGVNREDFT